MISLVGPCRDGTWLNACFGTPASKEILELKQMLIYHEDIHLLCYSNTKERVNPANWLIQRKKFLALMQGFSHGSIIWDHNQFQGCFCHDINLQSNFQQRAIFKSFSMHYMATFSRAVGRSENKDDASEGVTARGVTFRWCGFCSILYFAQLACWVAWPHFCRTQLHSPPNGDFCPRIWAS